MKCIEVLIIIFILIPGPSKKFQTWFEPQSFKINRTSYCNSLQRPGCANRRTKTGLLMTQVTACERASQWQQALNLLMMCTKPTVVTWLSSVRCQFYMRWKFWRNPCVPEYSRLEFSSANECVRLGRVKALVQCLDFFTTNPANCISKWIWPRYLLSFKRLCFQTFANPFVYDVCLYHYLFVSRYIQPQYHNLSI